MPVFEPDAAELLPVSLLAGMGGSLVLAAAGSRFRGWARVPVTPSLRFPVDFLVGGWVLGAVSLVLGLVGLLRPPVLLSILGVLAAAGRWRATGWRWRSLCVPVVPGLLLLPVALATPFFYDALVYHLGLPWQALQEGRWAPHPENLFAAFPPLAQMIYAYPLAAGWERVPALLHLASFLMAGLAVAALARRLGAPPGLAGLAGAALPLMPAVLLVGGFPAAEGWTVAAITAAFATAIGGRDLRGSALLVGFLLGCATAFRLQGLAWSAILLGFLFAHSRRPIRRSLVAGGGWLLGSMPWWLKNLLLLHEPWAPLGWRREGMESLWRDAGSLLYLRLGLGDIARTLGGTLAPTLSYLLPLLLAVSLTLIIRRGRTNGLLGVAVLMGTVAWAATGSLPRFLAPVLALMLALSAAGRRPLGNWVGGIAIGWSILLGGVGTARQMMDWGLIRSLVLKNDPGARSLILNNPLPAFRRADILPDSSRVLFLGEARSLGFPSTYVCPSQHDISPLREPLEQYETATEVIAWLRGRGFSHLFVNRAELVRLSAGYPVLPWSSEAGRRRFQSLLEAAGPPLVLEGEVALFSLLQAGGEP